MTSVLITGDLSVTGTATGFPRKVKTALLRDQKAAAFNGGVSSIGWNDRTLNTVDDPDDIVTLDGGNVLFTFNKTGTYWIAASVSSYAGTTQCLSKIVLTNSSNTLVLNGSSGSTKSLSPDGQNRFYLSGILTVTNTATQYKIRHYTSVALDVFGLGVSTDMGQVENYTIVSIIQLS